MSGKVLVVDDSSLIRNMVGGALTASGFAVVQAVDGQDGLEKLSQNPDVKLIVCDINMPNMNGIEFVERVAQTPAKDVAVIILSTERDPKFMDRAKALGVKGWLNKPFNKEVLLSAAKKVLG